MLAHPVFFFILFFKLSSFPNPSNYAYPVLKFLPKETSPIHKNPQSQVKLPTPSTILLLPLLPTTTTTIYPTPIITTYPTPTTLFYPPTTTSPYYYYFFYSYYPYYYLLLLLLLPLPLLLPTTLTTLCRHTIYTTN